MKIILQADNINKVYGEGHTEVRALAGLSFSLIKGEFVAVMGASGSGKSTFLNIIGGLDSPTSGKVFLDEIELTTLSEKKITLLRRNKIGYIFQFFNLMPTLTVEENIGLPFLIAGNKLKDKEAAIDDLIKTVGLDKRRNHKPEQLSGGEQQRVAIARALASEPSVILADEPTGNLDSKNGLQILNLLRECCDNMGQTIVMVTHDPKAAAYADRVIFLKDGRLESELAVENNGFQAIISKLQELEKLPEESIPVAHSTNTG